MSQLSHIIPLTTVPLNKTNKTISGHFSWELSQKVKNHISIIVIVTVVTNSSETFSDTCLLIECLESYFTFIATAVSNIAHSQVSSLTATQHLKQLMPSDYCLWSFSYEHSKEILRRSNIRLKDCGCSCVYAKDNCL